MIWHKNPLVILILLFTTKATLALHPGNDSIDNIILETRDALTLFPVIYNYSKEIFDTQPEIAMVYADKAAGQATKIRNDTLLAKAFSLKAEIYSRMNDPVNARQFLHKALELYRNCSMPAHTAKVHESIGRIHRDQAEYDSALFHYKSALEIHMDADDSANIAENLSDIGYMYRKKSDLDKALEYYQRSLLFFSGGNNQEEEALVLSRIGSVYNQLNDYRNAIKYYSLSLDLRNEINDEQGVAASLNNIGMVYMYRQEYDSALSIFFKALEINNDRSNDKYASYNLHNIAIIYDMQGIHDKALEYLDRSIMIKQQRNDQRGLAASYNSKGLISINKGDYAGAVEFLKESEKIARQIGYRENILRNYDNLENLYVTTGNYKKAYEYSKRNASLKDSILNEEKLNSIAEYQTKLETLLKEKENQELKSSLLLSQKKEEAQRRLQLFLIIFIIILTITTVLIISNLRLRKISLQKDKQLAEKNADQYKSQLDFRNRELASNALFLAQNNELINSILNNIRKLKEHTDEKGKKIILDLILSVKKNSQENAWKEFETRFENVHIEFYKNLQSRFPDLTPNERKLCAFLRLNMTSKDIAAITYLSVRSIETARTRLRKKLRLPADANLVSFLSNY